jgi:hypothetical protein
MGDLTGYNPLSTDLHRAVKKKQVSFASSLTMIQN